MPKLPPLRPSRVVRALKRLGFRVERQRGSHLQLTQGGRLVTVPMHARDLHTGVLASILRQAGVTLEELKDRL